MIWHIIALAAVASCLWLGLAEASSVLVLNASNESKGLPRQFRTVTMPFSIKSNSSPSLLGLNQLRISGSGQFAKEELASIYKKLNYPNPFIVIDLREECHGFVNGSAVSWYGLRDWANVGKTRQEIITEELDLLSKLQNSPKIVVKHVLKKNSEGAIESSQSMMLEPKNVQTEEELIASNGWHYLRIPVTDHLPPSKEAVDQFLTYYRTLPTNAWIHFHCAGGEGRTTTFMSLVDILHNSQNVSFEDILERQHLIGGSNLLTAGNSNIPWKADSAHLRLDFLKTFYMSSKKKLDQPSPPLELQ